jgi:hypothetical protein
MSKLRSKLLFFSKKVRLFFELGEIIPIDRK